MYYSVRVARKSKFYYTYNDTILLKLSHLIIVPVADE